MIPLLGMFRSIFGEAVYLAAEAVGFFLDIFVLDVFSFIFFSYSLF